MTTTKATTQRRLRIDFFRLVAMFMIVCAHIQYFGNFSHEGFFAKTAQLAIVISTRYSIQFFFIFAGYFVGGKIAQEPSKATSIAYTYTKRLAAIFLFWCAIYALENPHAFVSLVQAQPLKVIFEGTRVHLWFLVSLILTVWLFVVWPGRNTTYSFLLLGGILYVVGLLAGAYKVTPIGINLHFDTRDGVFFSTLFFAIGIAFRRKTPQVNTWVALGIALGGLALFALEALYLKLQWGLSPLEPDYLLGSIPFGIGVALLALKQPDSPLDQRVGPYGRYVLGVYAGHLLFFDLFNPLGSFVQPLVWQLVFPVLVFGLSLLAGIALARTPLRSVVM